MKKNSILFLFVFMLLLCLFACDTKHEHSYHEEFSFSEESHWYECACGDKKDIVAHDFSIAGEVTKEPTEETTGTQIYSCVCGKTTEKEIPVKEHTHNYATTLSSDAESHWYECACGDKKDIVAHDFSIAGEVIKEPTWENTGIQIYSCICGETKEVEVPAKGNISDNLETNWNAYVTNIVSDSPTRYQVLAHTSAAGLYIKVDQYVNNVVIKNDPSDWISTHVEMSLWHHSVGYGVQYGFYVDTYFAFFADGTYYINNLDNCYGVYNEVTIVENPTDSAYQYKITYNIYVAFDNNLDNPQDDSYAFAKFMFMTPDEDNTGYEDAAYILRDGLRPLWSDRCDSYEIHSNGITRKDGVFNEVNVYVDGEFVKKIRVGSKLDIETPTKTGYQFVGWSCNDKLWDLENDTVTEDIYLVPLWVKTDYSTRNENGILNKIQTLNNTASQYWYISYEDNGIRIIVDILDDYIDTNNTNVGMNDNIEFILGMNTTNDSLAPNNSFNVMITLGRDDQNWARQAKDYSSYGDNLYDSLISTGKMVVNKSNAVQEVDGFIGVKVDIFIDCSVWDVDKEEATGNMTILLGGRNNDSNGNSLFRFFSDHCGIWNYVNTASRIMSDGKVVNNYFDLPSLEEELANSSAYVNGKTIENDMASLVSTNGLLIREYKVGAQLFTDRDYYADEDGMFAELIGKSYFRSKMDGTQQFKVTKAGYVIVALPSSGSFSTTNANYLTNNGFVRIADNMPIIGYNSVSKFMSEETSYYIKWCEVNEEYELAKWGIVIFGAEGSYDKDTWIETPGIVIKLDTEELKEKYAPTTRLWQGIPGITSVKTQNGTRLWASWFTGSTGEPNVGNYAVYYYSDDDGENWIPAFVATFDYDIINDSRVYDPAIFTDNDNNLYIWWNQTNHSFGSGSVWYSKISNADKDFELMEAMTPVNTGPGLKLNKPIITSTGEWLYVAHDVTDRTYTYVYSSTDKGLTWSVKGRCSVTNGRNFFEPAIVEVLDDNSEEVTLMMWNRCTENYYISVSYSYDGGVTWTSQTEFIPTNTMYSGPSSRMNCLAFTHNGVNYIAYVQHYNTTSRNNIAIFLSNDGGKTFPYALILDTNSGVSYPDVRYIDDHLYVVWDYNRYGEKRVFMAKLTVEEILAVNKVGVLDRSRIQFISSLTTANAPLNLSGYVYDNDGDPLNGATVTYGSYVTTTDSNGYYEFNNIYYVANEKVVISKEDYFSSEIKLTENMVIDSEFNYKTISHLEKINELNVFGILKNRYGNVLSDAFVTIGDVSVKTDENGYFEVNNILPNINGNELTIFINCDINSDYVVTIPYSQFNSENNYTVELNLEILEDNVTDLGYVGNEGANGYYHIYAIRTENSIAIEALTEVSLTANGLDKIEIFFNVDKFYNVGGSSTRNSQFVLFNIFSSGLIRGWNYSDAKQTQLFSEAKNKVTYSGVTINNTVTIPSTGLNKIYFEIPYSFFYKLNEKECGLDGVTANTVVNESTPIGLYILSGYKVGSNWKSYDNWSYKVVNGSNKGNPAEMAILTHETTIVKNYATYMNNVLSSFDSLSNYVEAVYGKGLEGNMASFDTIKYKTKVYEPGALLFSDRDGHKVPADGGVGALNGLTYIYDSVTGSNTSIEATKSGYLLMAMDDNNITNADIANWDFISKSYLPNLGVNTAAKSASLYIIWVEAGQTVTVPANALVFTL